MRPSTSTSRPGGVSVSAAASGEGSASIRAWRAAIAPGARVATSVPAIASTAPMPPTMKPATRGPEPGEVVSMERRFYVVGALLRVTCCRRSARRRRRRRGRRRRRSTLNEGDRAGRRRQLDALGVERLLDPTAQLAGDVPLRQRPALDPHAYGHLAAAERLDRLHLDRRQHVAADGGILRNLALPTDAQHLDHAVRVLAVAERRRPRPRRRSPWSCSRAW